MSRDPLLFLEDIEKSCKKVLRYTEGLENDVPALLDAVQRIIRLESQTGD